VTLVIDKLSGIPVRQGVAKNDTMLRVDVFSKQGRFHLVPVYVHHRVKGLPDRAIVAFKDEDEWTQIDDSFEFLFSLYPNDLVRVTQKSKAQIFWVLRRLPSGNRRNQPLGARPEWSRREGRADRRDWRENRSSH